MYFLGQAANYRARDVLRHTFAWGTAADAERLRQHLAARYGTIPDATAAPALARVALYGTGRSALAAAIRATVPKGSAVCVTALTCYAVIQAVEAAGCTPVFADIDPATLHYGPAELKKALRLHPDLRAIIVQNNLGHPADISGLEQLANRHHLAIIEDLAHSAGVRYADGREAGTVGAATILSFGKGKAIDTIAGGACILRHVPAPSDTKPAASAARLRQPQRRPSLANSLRARWYPFFGACIRGFDRLKLGRYFTALLLKLHFIERSADAPLSLTTRCTHWQAKLALRQLAALTTPRPPLREFAFVQDRDQVLAELARAGYHFGDIWYDIPVAPERYFDRSHYVAAECPVATRLAAHIVNLPTHYPARSLAPARRIIRRHTLPPQEVRQ